MSAAFAGAFDNIVADGESRIAVAVSGGGDSTALLLALKDHVDRSGSGARLVALTVDHRLRPEAAAEAAQVAALCDRLGVAHRTLAWTEAKPATGLAEAARLARYRLLAAAARAEGARLVLTGHTADDQAETVAMRGLRGDGPGLAGIAPATLYAGETWFARPFIAVRRAALRDFLTERDIGWIEDPSNADPARERARTRAALGRSGDGERLIAEAAAAAIVRRAAMAGVAGFLDRHALMASPGLVRVETAAFADAGVAAEVLRLLAATIGGKARPPAADRASALVARIGRGESLRATLAGAVIDASPKGVFFHREWRGGGPEAVAASAGAVFDGRFRVVSDAPGARIEALGNRAPTGAGRLADAAARAEAVVVGVDAGAVKRSATELAAQAAPPSPSGLPPPLTPPHKGEGNERGSPSPLWGGDRGGGIANRPWRKSERDSHLFPIVSPFALFLSDFDLPAANALARLVGAAEFPPSPWRGHIAAIGS